MISLASMKMYSAKENLMSTLRD